MGRLNINVNDPNKDPNSQFRQINIALQDTENWANTLPTNLLINYQEAQGTTNLTNNSLNYVDLPGFNFNFVLNNTLCQLSFNLALAGNAGVGVIVNGGLTQEVFSYSPSVTSGIAPSITLPITHNNFYNLKAGNNQVKLQWRALNGTITKANSVSTPGLNNFQVISFS